MTLAAGSRLGPYEILAPLGAGGMGEVYRARDTRLERTVAVKVLSPLLADSPDSRQRFEREAKAISQLSHPHICTLYDVGREGETEYLVMEYLEGETLAERLKKGALPLAQILEHGRQIADALEKAHRQGIVHRDLKPGNVMITKSGVKLLDFGLAKAFRPRGESELISHATTSGLTSDGMIIGTIQYMAPEQLEGKKVDARTDIFALGAVLYEMVSGRKAFSGDSQASLIVAIMHVDPPPLSDSPPLAPAPLDRVVRKCLAKDPDQRWQSAHDVATELEWLKESGSGGAAFAPTAAATTTGSGRRERVLWPLGAVTLAALLALGWLALRRPSVAPARRVFPLLPSSAEVGSVAVSPDGRKVALTTSEFSSVGGIWIRSIDSLETTRLTGTEGAADPFWSPDGRDIGFFSGGKLRRMSVEGGAQQTLADAERYGGAWNRQGTILYAPTFGRALMRVSATGGAPEPVTTLDASRGEVLHAWPVFLPDQKHFVFFARAIDPAKSAIWVGELGSKERSLVTPADGGPIFVAPGYLLFAREGALLAQRFDASSRTLSGEPIPQARRVALDPSNNDLNVSASSQLLVYQSGDPRNRQLTWFDRTGKPLGKIGAPAEYWTYSLSPDERQIVASIADPDRRTGNLWIIDVARGTRTRLTSRPTDEFNPRWSNDGYIYYTSDPDGFYDLFRTPAAGSGAEEKVFQSGMDKWVNDLSRDGRALLFTDFDLKTNYNVWMVPVGAAGEPAALFQANFPETDGVFSPDGQWIVYVSRESGREEVFIAPRAAPARRQQVSVDGGGQPRWSRDGREIYFISPARNLMAAPIRWNESNAEVLEPKPLFFSKDFLLGWDLRTRTTYEVASDGRFLFAVPVDEPDARSVVAVVDWAAPLTR
jgi:Tol biopolymer transport system component